VLAEVGMFLGSLAAGDLAIRSRQQLTHDAGTWAVRKRELTGSCSARWAESITKATHDQWALARRGQAAHLAWLRGQIASIEARLARPLGTKADRRAGLPRGYGSRAEWHAKSRRLHALKVRLERVEADWAAGRVHVVRGGKQLALARFPAAKLKSRLVSMAAEQDIAIVAVDPAYTSRWGAQHWQKPLTTPTRKITATTRLPWRSDGAPSGIRSGDGRHRPHTTRVIVRGIGPSRPDRRSEGVRKLAPTFLDHARDA